MIDARELRVGNHVLVDGEWQEVYGISSKGITIRYDADPLWGCAILTEHADIQPIPLTAELLTEIGFEQGSDNREWHKYIGEAWIGIHLFLDRERMRVNVCDDSADYGNLIIRYLHELEGFIYMTLHRELIEE